MELTYENITSNFLFLEVDKLIEMHHSQKGAFLTAGAQPPQRNDILNLSFSWHALQAYGDFQGERAALIGPHGAVIGKGGLGGLGGSGVGSLPQK